MTDLVVVTALRSEYVALAGQVGDATLLRCGMGPDRVRAWLPALAEAAPSAVVVAGVAGGLDPSLRAGDVVVATEVRDEHGRIPLRGWAPLAAELRRLGLRVRTGPMLSVERVVGGASERERLAATGALAVDMESAAVVRASLAVPVAVVRVVVDTAVAPVTRLSTIPHGIRALRVLRNVGPALTGWARLRSERRVLLIGYEGPDETEGALGDAPGEIHSAQNAIEAEQVMVADPGSRSRSGSSPANRSPSPSRKE